MSGGASLKLGQEDLDSTPRLYNLYFFVLYLSNSLCGIIEKFSNQTLPSESVTKERKRITLHLFRGEGGSSCSELPQKAYLVSFP